MKTIHVELRIQIEDDADAHDAIQQCDFRLAGCEIIDAEIVSVTDEFDQKVF